MVLITEITPVRSFFRITVDTGDQYWIRREDLRQSGFAVLSEYEPEDFSTKIRLCQYPRALNHAVSLLARRPYSKKEIIDRLIRLRYTDEVAGLVVFKLEKEKILNDEDFCEQWIRYRMSRRYGSAVIRRELRQKGIPEGMVANAFSRLPEDDEQDNAVNLARKAWKRFQDHEDIRKSRQKIIVSLVRKGYDWETARAACETAENETE